MLTHNGLKVDLRIGAEEEFGNLLQHFTGSASPQRRSCGSDARARGLSVSEHGVTEVEGRRSRSPTEERRLRAARPTLHRAGAARGPRRAEGGARRASCRSWSRSRTSAATCTPTRPSPTAATRWRRWPRRPGERGYAYLAVTDHSASHGFGNHVTPRRLAKRIEEIGAWNESAHSRLPPARRLGGQHRHRGRPDYPDELLVELDWVICSVHTSFKISDEEMTERVIAAIEHPLVDCIGHLTGPPDRPPRALRDRHRGGRGGGGAHRHDAGDQRQPEPPRPQRGTRAAGGRGRAWIVFNTDAHGIDTLSNMTYSVATARRAWLTPATSPTPAPGGTSRGCSAELKGVGCCEVPGCAPARRAVRLSSGRRRSGRRRVARRRGPRPLGCARRGRRAARSRRRRSATPGKKTPRTPATTAVTATGQRRPRAIRAGVSPAGRSRCGPRPGRRGRPPRRGPGGPGRSRARGR